MSRYYTYEEQCRNAKNEVLKAAKVGELARIKTLLDSKVNLLQPIDCSLSKVFEVFVESNNQEGVKLLLDYNFRPEHEVILNAKSRAMALYLMQQGIDPYHRWEGGYIQQGPYNRWEWNNDKFRFSLSSQDDENKYFFFSAGNIKRLKNKDSDLLRDKDYRVIGTTLNNLAKVLITKVLCFENDETLVFLCSCTEDAQVLKDFLNGLGLSYYVDKIDHVGYFAEHRWVIPAIAGQVYTKEFISAIYTQLKIKQQHLIDGFLRPIEVKNSNAFFLGINRLVEKHLDTSSLDSYDLTNRPLSKLAAEEQVLGGTEAQNRSVHTLVHEDSSAVPTTTQLPHAVESNATLASKIYGYNSAIAFSLISEEMTIDHYFSIAYCSFRNPSRGLRNAKEVFKNLNSEFNQFKENIFKDPNYPNLNSLTIFTARAQDIIDNAMPVLQKDLEWKEYFENTLKQIANLFIAMINYIRELNLAFYSLHHSKAAKAVLEVNNTIQSQSRFIN